MIVYFILFLFIIFCYFIQTKGKLKLDYYRLDADLQNKFDKQIITISFALLIILTAFRSVYVGPDTRQYVNHFYRVCNGVYSRLDDQFELGYRLFTFLLSKVTHNEHILLFLIALLTNIPIARFIYKYSKNRFLSIILYVSIGSFLFQLTGLRQSIAMSFCVLAIDYAITRKPVKFVLFVVIAFFFHRSAIMFLPVYFFGNPKITKKRVLLIFLCFVSIVFANFFLQKVFVLLNYEEYSNTSGVTGLGGWTLVSIMLITLFLSLWVRKYFPVNTEDENVEQFFFVLLLFACSLYLIRYQVRVAERVSLYYRIALIVLLPNVIVRFKNYKLKFILCSLCGLFAIVLFFYWLKGSQYLYTPFWDYNSF